MEDIESQGLLNPPEWNHVCFDSSCQHCINDRCNLDEECEYKRKGERNGA